MAILQSCLPVVVAVATLLPAQGPQSPAMPPPAITIGVIDLDKAIDRYAVAVKERERLQGLSEEFREEINRLTQRIDELRGQLSLLKPGSFEHEQTELDLRLGMNQREGLAGLLKRRFDRERDAFELEVYEDMEYAIARVAKDRGIAIVLHAQPAFQPVLQDGEDPVELQKARLVQYTRRTVWYTGPEVDLTPYVIKYLQVFDPRAERKKAAEAAADKPDPGKQEPAQTGAGKQDRK